MIVNSISCILFEAPPLAPFPVRRCSPRFATVQSLASFRGIRVRCQHMIIRCLITPAAKEKLRSAGFDVT